jgi:hypothetical protein
MSSEPDDPHPPVRAVRITDTGALEVVYIRSHSDLAAAVEAVGPCDVTARATWPAKGGGVLTVWAARSAPRSRRNDLALRVVDELLPRLDGPIDRVWERIHDDPPAGPVLVTGYLPRSGTEPGVTASVPDVALERIRCIADGRKARREAAAACQAPTVALPTVGAPTTRLAVADPVAPAKPRPRLAQVLRR